VVETGHMRDQRYYERIRHAKDHGEHDQNAQRGYMLT
jgi:hypothetical protein